MQKYMKRCEHALNIQIILVITKKYTHVDKAKISPWGKQKTPQDILRLNINTCLMNIKGKKRFA